ncbi:MAG: 1-acyl-sn-glycerol-3-phosphate acyltransferase [Salinivirgaceae bacterium]|nr:1-acyl-sn-glycerol-3-phosphate acyltransferase [Salinivirgaceae bacterium]
MVGHSKGDTFTKIELEALIKSKNPALLKVIPRFVLRKFKRILHLDEINEFLEHHHNDDPYEFIDSGLKMFGASIIIEGKENLPPENKRLLMVANHPLGGLDGLVFMKVVHDIYGDLRFPVNDLLLNLPGLNQVFLPVNKHGTLNRDSFLAIDQAYRSNLPILYFPAGLCSRKIKGKVVDLEWKKSIITNAVKHQRDIVPVYIMGRNSDFFYNLANFRKRIGLKANIEMLYLADEMFKQKDRQIVIRFGKPIPWAQFDDSKSSQEWADFLKVKTYEME